MRVPAVRRYFGDRVVPSFEQRPVAVEVGGAPGESAGHTEDRQRLGEDRQRLGKDRQRLGKDRQRLADRRVG